MGDFMVTKAIKGVDEETWNRFKAQAARKGMEMSEYLGFIVEDSDRYDSREWLEDLLEFVRKNPSPLTDKDVARMNRFRKGFKMRKF
ncbi:hypothetical protein CMO88_04190 [Candidatus Woesearchaeota archaeon]|nr:hypothetical protein [Candidatus Woesearchaeota archaeon]|tara:strand:- start:11518 stop:11778 length:261 start_codon:yes stop_codon:yes gene_type:complete